MTPRYHLYKLDDDAEGPAYHTDHVSVLHPCIDPDCDGGTIWEHYYITPAGDYTPGQVAILAAIDRATAGVAECRKLAAEIQTKIEHP